MTAVAPIDIGTLIAITPGMLGGSPRIAGTRISVKHIAECFNAGMPADQIVRQFPTIDLKGAYAAITYYMANKAAVDQELLDDEGEVERFIRDYPNGRGPETLPSR